MTCTRLTLRVCSLSESLFLVFYFIVFYANFFFKSYFWKADMRMVHIVIYNIVGNFTILVAITKSLELKMTEFLINYLHNFVLIKHTTLYFKTNIILCKKKLSDIISLVFPVHFNKSPNLKSDYISCYVVCYLYYFFNVN